MWGQCLNMLLELRTYEVEHDSTRRGAARETKQESGKGMTVYG